MKKQTKITNIPVILPGMYVVFVLARFLPALLTSAYPFVNIDEFLYYGITRSIANGEGLMFRGQPADYSYIFYSLVLSPVYLTGLKGPVLYRAMQLWNILLITLSIFPLYRIAVKCVRDERKALWLTGISMLLPDFLLGQLMMAENVIIPLFYTLFCLILGYLENEKLWKILLIGLIGGLLFSAKPGAVIPAAVFFILLLVFSLAKRDIKQFPRIGAGAAVMIAAAGFFFLLVKLLNGNASVLSLYENQITDTAHLDVFFRFIGVYILYFLIASGFGCVFLLGKKYKYFSFDRKFVLYVILLSLIITIIGVSWSVNRYEYNANTAHMRYIGMYIPLLFIFSMIPLTDLERRHKSKQKLSVFAVLPAAVFIFLLIVIGIYAGVNQYTVFPENMTFSVLIQLFRDKVSGSFLTAIICSLCLMFVYLIWQKEIQKAERAAVIVLIACMVINNVTAYGISRQDTRFTYADNADKLLKTIPDSTDLLFVYTDDQISSYYGAMDVYSPKGITYVSLNDLFNHLYDTKGIYVPFIPDGLRGNIPVRETPDTDTIFLDPTSYAMLKLSENAEHLTFNEDGLHLVKITDKNERWLDWVIGNTENLYLEAGNTGILLIFSDKYIQSPLTFRFKVMADSDMVFIIFSDVEAKTVQLEAGLHEYEITFGSPMNVYNFRTDGGTLRFHSFVLINE